MLNALIIFRRFHQYYIGRRRQARDKQRAFHGFQIMKISYRQIHYNFPLSICDALNKMALITIGKIKCHRQCLMVKYFEKMSSCSSLWKWWNYHIDIYFWWKHLRTKRFRWSAARMSVKYCRELLLMAMRTIHGEGMIMLWGVGINVEPIWYIFGDWNIKH